MFNRFMKSPIEFFPEPVPAKIDLVEENVVRAACRGTSWRVRLYNPNSTLALHEGQRVQVIGREGLTLLIDK
jgi:membrane protein implicated in regulation of membrane protease activity